MKHSIVIRLVKTPLLTPFPLREEVVVTITPEHNMQPHGFNGPDAVYKKPIRVTKQPTRSHVSSGLTIAELKALINTPGDSISAMLADLDPFQAVLKEVRSIDSDKAFQNALAPLADLDSVFENTMKPLVDWTPDGIMSEINDAVRAITSECGH